MNYKIGVIFSKDEYGYYVYVPAFPGCHSQGSTYEEASANIKEAIELYLESVPAEEIRQLVSNEILTTTIDVSVA
ncbi:MAG: type II toxin-antitoxin system HicB family antitoxin [Bacteroidetes bacterium]|nr:type II toxin-antitoxin system HicB family antitoxin [Bacteroidota bacterium]